MITPQIIISFELEIIDVLNDGFIGTELKKESRISDKFALSNNSFKIGDSVQIKISVINEEDIKKDKQGKEFYCVINELTNNGLYTKSYDENVSRFKRRFWYESRGMITFPREEFNRFEVGDILKVEIKK